MQLQNYKKCHQSSTFELLQRADTQCDAYRLQLFF